jgi:radical SAM family uncharacterized protein/radical SAM-linked protein
MSMSENRHGRRPRRLPAGVLERMLEKVMRPGRYTGGEINIIRKDHGEPGLVRFALVYPDLYDIGMANLSIRILYDLLNRMDGVSAERAFLPDLDMEKEYRKRNQPLTSLENRTFLNDFDFIGITVQSELTATNIPHFLHLSHLPLLARQRGSAAPLVIGGGPCLMNPEPYADFFDLFLLGDAEKSLPKIINLYKDMKNRKTFLKTAPKINGVYVPGQWEKKYFFSDSRKLKLSSIRNRLDPSVTSVRSAVIDDLDSVPFPEKQIVPLINIPQNRAIIEVSRGCLNNCRFCSAGYLYRPLRDRSLDSLVKIAENIIAETGYSTLSLLSLSISNYERLPELMDRLNAIFRNRRVQISLPSLRIDAFGLGILEKFAGLKKSGLTFALESMSQEIRLFLNKGQDSGDFMEIIGRALEKKWRTVKIYLMFGFPFEDETEINIRGIQELADYVKKRSSAELTFHFMPFIPKPGTPFQWLRFKDPEFLRKSMETVCRSVKRKNVKLKWHDIDMAYLESIMCAADRDFGKVILKAWKQGARFDGWDEKFKRQVWLPLLKDYLRNHSRDENDILPWEHIDFGIKKEFLKNEYKRALELAATASCRDANCYDCGSCGKNTNRIEKSTEENRTPEVPKPALPSSDDKFFFLEIVFSKTGPGRWISHLDLVNLWEKALNISGLHVRHSFGFSPHKKFAVLGALQLGMESERELIVCEILKNEGIEDAVNRMNTWLPDGIRIISGTVTQDRSQFKNARFFTYQMHLGGISGPVESRIRTNPAAQEFVRLEKHGFWKLTIRLEKNLYKLLTQECGIPRTKIKSVRKTGWS